MNNLYVNGTEEQRMKFLPPLCSGEKIGGVCISDPDSGTDVIFLLPSLLENSFIGHVNENEGNKGGTSLYFEWTKDVDYKRKY